MKWKQREIIMANKISILINKILYLQIINFLLFFLILFYQNKNIVLNNQNKQKAEEKSKNIRDTISEKIKYLKILTNNNEKEYKGIQECLLNDPEEKILYLSFNIT